MSEQSIGKWGAAVLAVMMLFAVGCAKKQVKTSDTAAAPAAPSAPGQATPAPEGIVTETMKPPADTQTARAAEAAEGIAATQEKPSPFQDIHFDFNMSVVRADAKSTLSSVADYMKKNKGAKLLIEGHCDERGTAEYNMALGDRRAEAARAYLVSLGVPASALSTVSFGKEKPLDPGNNDVAWAKNRRAHFVVK
jgi:peptidoglycan-associated lipoprotein